MTKRPVTRRRLGLIAAFVVVGVLTAEYPVGAQPTTKAVAAKSSPNWLSWRGPTGDNHAPAGATAPVSVEKAEVLWNTPVPERGHASPIVIDDLIVIATADTSAGTQTVLAYDRATGKLSWQTVIHKGGLPADNHPHNTEASCTCVSDGERIYCSFYNNDAIWLTALSLAGKVQWQENLGAYTLSVFKYGYAASPLIYKNSVIVVADCDGASFLCARDKITGKEVWRTPRHGRLTFSSPIIAHTSGKDQLVISGGNQVVSYDPLMGKQLWSAPALATATCGTMVWDDERVYGSGGYPESQTAAIASDGSGKIVWKNSTKLYEQSLLEYDGYVYAVSDNGAAYCFRATDGQEMWKGRVGSKCSSSPVLVGNQIHIFSEGGTWYVFMADPTKLIPVAKSQLGDEAFATPAVLGDTMYMRYADNSGGQATRVSDRDAKSMSVSWQPDSLGPSVVESLDSVPTPFVRVDGDIVRRNIERLVTSARERNLSVRPHIKTHKSREIAKMQLDAGCIGLTVAKVGEAVAMAGVNASRSDDLLVAYPIVAPARAARLADLAVEIRPHGGVIRVGLDSLFAAQIVADAARSRDITIGILIDIDTGNQRTGLSEVDAIRQLAREIDRIVKTNQSLRLDGLFLFPGHVKGAAAEQQTMIAAESDLIAEIKAALAKDGLTLPIISGGSTPTQRTAHGNRHLTEIRPGTSVYNDANTVRGGYCELSDCAATVVTTVVSTSVPGRMIVDAGSKTLTSDRCGPAPDSGYGIVVDHPDAVVVGLYEEHGIIEFPTGSERPRLGTRLAIIPNHICPCVNLHDTFYLRTGADRWKRLPVDARGAVT